MTTTVVLFEERLQHVRFIFEKLVMRDSGSGTFEFNILYEGFRFKTRVYTEGYMVILKGRTERSCLNTYTRIIGKTVEELVDEFVVYCRCHVKAAEIFEDEHVIRKKLLKIFSVYLVDIDIWKEFFFVTKQGRWTIL